RPARHLRPAHPAWTRSTRRARDRHRTTLLCRPTAASVLTFEGRPSYHGRGARRAFRCMACCTSTMALLETPYMVVDVDGSGLIVRARRNSTEYPDVAT